MGTPPAMDPRVVPTLVADIGGTNARFARLIHGELHAEAVLTCAHYPDVAAAVEHYLAGTPPPRPKVAAMAVATPVTDDWIQMTNHHWRFSVKALRRQLALERLLVLNDFTALALAVPGLARHHLVPVGGGAAVPGKAKALLGPGTGLGVSGLLPAGGGWVPIEGEGGHVTYSPTTPRERTVVVALEAKRGHVSAEALLSGPGLVQLYHTLAQLEGQTPAAPEPAAVVQRALDRSCPLCIEALEIFCAALGTVAGNLALTLGARGGVYLGGGIVGRLIDVLPASAFRLRFEAKGRFQGYLAAIPCFVIQAPHPALAGAGAALAVPGLGVDEGE